MVRPRSGARPGGDHYAVEANFLTVGEVHPLRGQIHADGGDAQPPFGIEPAQARQRGLVGRRVARQDLLGQRRAVVGLVGLFADQGQLSAKTLLAQRLSRPQSRQRRTDDHDPPAAVAGLGNRAGHTDPVSWASCEVSNGSIRIAWTGQAAAARRIC